MSLRPITIATVLLLLLHSAAHSQERKAAKALFLDLATAPESCGDGRDILVTAIGRHRAKVNMEPDIAIAEIGPKLRAALRYRAEKIVYVKAQSDVSWGEFLDLLDSARPEVEIISLLTQQVDVLSRRHLCLAPSCGDCAHLRRLHAN
jgi:hypothetical protein